MSGMRRGDPLGVAKGVRHSNNRRFAMLKKVALAALAVSALGGCGSAPIWSNAYGYDNATFRTIVVSPAGEVFIGYNFGQTKAFERLPAALDRPGGGSGPRAFQVSEQ